MVLVELTKGNDIGNHLIHLAHPCPIIFCSNNTKVLQNDL